MLLWFVCWGSFGLHLNQNKSESKSLNLPRCSHDSVFIPLPPPPSLPLSSVCLQLSTQTRSEVIKRATRTLRQLCEKSKKRGDGSGEQERTDPAGMTFDEAIAHLQQSQAHLDTLSHAFIQSLKDVQQVPPVCQTLEPFSVKG